MKTLLTHTLMAKHKYISIILFTPLLFSGCQSVDSAIEIKNNVTNQVNEITENINQIEANLNEKKRELDQKLIELEEAQEALSNLFETNSSKKEEKETIEQKVYELKGETQKIQQEVLIDSQNIEILEKSKNEELFHAPTGIFSIE